MATSTQPIVIDGVTYHPDEIYTRSLLVHGAEPTNFEDYKYINVLVNHYNRNPNAGGMAQAEYRYRDLADLSKFHEHEYPYYLDVKMITASDRKGRQIQVIVHADFANAKEMELVPRERKPKVTPAPTTKV